MNHGSIGLKEAGRRTGLSRMQLRYLEQRGLLGYVARSAGRTVYTLEQFELLERIARIRALGASIDESAALARELAGERATVPADRVDQLIRRALIEVEGKSRAANDLSTLRSRRLRLVG